MTAVLVDTGAAVDEVIARALSCRRVGSSTAHDESSRSHVLFELEVVTRALATARAAALFAEVRACVLLRALTDVGSGLPVLHACLCVRHARSVCLNAGVLCGGGS